MSKMETKSGLSKLSGEYNRGYTKALMDFQKILDYIVLDLKSHHKNLTTKLAKKLIQCCIENRGNLRDYENIDGFIRYNSKTEEFEYYKPDEVKRYNERI